MKIINYSHSDTDGCVCSILVNEYARQKNIPCVVNKARYEIIDELFKDNYSKEDFHIITDISLKNEPEWLKNVNNVLLIDHHSGNEKSTLKNKVIDSHEGTSACKLVYEYFTSKGCVYDEKFKKLMELGHDHDSWNHLFKSSKALNYLYYFYTFGRFFDRFKNGFDKFSKDELCFLKCKNDEIKYALTNLEYSAIIDDVAFIIVENNLSEVAEELYTNRGFMYVFMYSPQRKALSMRSRKDATIHCGEFLQLFGGGGHRNSGGVLVDGNSKIDEVLKGFRLVYEEYHPPF
jgi:oligoribonuclease NrnB/cAMP/cGMP phosphodiesterase (DHH superfamily)